MKKIRKLFVWGLLCVSLVACSKENDNYNEVTSQEPWLSIKENNTQEIDGLEEIEVFLVEPIKTVDQIASKEEELSILQLLSQLDTEDFLTAKVYDKNNTEIMSDNQIMLLYQSRISNIYIYGYKSSEYGFRGLVSCFNGEYSYYDIIWRGKVGELKFDEQDFDNDGMSEIAFCFEGAVGTGVEIYRLIMFDEDEKSKKLIAHEFTPDMQLELFEDKMQFIVDMQKKKIQILKSGETKGIIDWERLANSTGEDYFGIDCLNQITFDINEDGIRMCVEIGILLNKGGPTTFFTEEEGGKLYLDIMYSDGIYEIF